MDGLNLLVLSTLHKLAEEYLSPVTSHWSDLMVVSVQISVALLR